VKPLVVLRFLGSTLDASKVGPTRCNKWRPAVGLTMHEDLRVDRLVLLHDSAHSRLASYVTEHIGSVSPETTVEPHLLDFKDPSDFEEATASCWTSRGAIRAWNTDAALRDRTLNTLGQFAGKASCVSCAT
jgi:sigma54-dependent transcription regulator